MSALKIEKFAGFFLMHDDAIHKINFTWPNKQENIKND